MLCQIWDASGKSLIEINIELQNLNVMFNFGELLWD